MTVMVDFVEVRRNRHTASAGTFFSQQELRLLLDVYSRRVASGEWRDYAIDADGGSVAFSVFRHTFDRPLFSVVKKADGKRSQYVVESGRRILARARSLHEALKVFDRPFRVVS